MLINYNVQQSQFFDITSDTHGAAISVSRDNYSLKLISNLFVNCSAPVEGGGFYASVERVEAPASFSRDALRTMKERLSILPAGVCIRISNRV